MQLRAEDGVLAHLGEVPDGAAVADGGALGDVGRVEDPNRHGQATRSAWPTTRNRTSLEAVAVEDVAAVDDHLDAGEVGGGQLAVLGVVGLHDDDVGRVAEGVGRPAVPGELLGGVHRVVHGDLGPGGPQGLDGGEDAGERRLLDPAAVGGTEHRDALAGEVATGGADGEADGVGRHRGVGLARGAHDGGVGVVPEVQARVDRDAVPADRDAGPVDVAVGLRVAGLDDLVDVDAGPGGERAELVGETDVHVAVGGLGELGHLGRLGRAEVPDPVAALEVGALVELQHRLVELDGSRGALGGQPADQLGVLAQVGEDPAGEHPLGREDEVEVDALDEPRPALEQRLPAGARGADRQRGLVADQGAGGEAAGDVVGGGVHPAEVGPGLVVDEQRHDHHDRVALAHRRGGVGGRAQRARADDLAPASRRGGPPPGTARCPR